MASVNYILSWHESRSVRYCFYTRAAYAGGTGTGLRRYTPATATRIADLEQLRFYGANEITFPFKI